MEILSYGSSTKEEGAAAIETSNEIIILIGDACIERQSKRAYTSRIGRQRAANRKLANFLTALSIKDCTRARQDSPVGIGRQAHQLANGYSCWLDRTSGYLTEGNVPQAAPVS